MNSSDKTQDGVVETTEGSTRVLTIDNGPRNLLTPHIMSELRAKLIRASDDSDIRAVLLTGTGDCFCGGLDLAAIREGADPVAFGRGLVDLLKIFPLLEVPVASAVNGDALASGASLVAASDYAVASEGVRIGTIETGVGMWPMIAQIPLIHRLGARGAIENVGSGEPFNAHRSLELGLVQRLVDPGSEMAAAQGWLDHASRAPEATPTGRPSLYEFADMEYGEALDASLERFAALFK